jgi:hypothetical protein
VSRPGRNVTYCGVGIAATSDALALTLLGESDVAVYDDSLQEWTSNAELPLEVGWRGKADTPAAMGRMFLQILGAIATLEHAPTSEHTLAVAMANVEISELWPTGHIVNRRPAPLRLVWLDVQRHLSHFRVAGDIAVTSILRRWHGIWDRTNM